MANCFVYMPEFKVKRSIVYAEYFNLVLVCYLCDIMSQILTITTINYYLSYKLLGFVHRAIVFLYMLLRLQTGIRGCKVQIRKSQDANSFFLPMGASRPPMSELLGV